MHFKNNSQYPTDEVRELVQFGMRDIDTTGPVYVTVEDLPAQRNRLYKQLSNHTAPKEGITQTCCKTDGSGEWSHAHVLLEIAGPEHFPGNNLFYTSDIPHLNGKPYGGHDEDYYTVENWQEGLVAVAAHEGYHVQAGRVNSRNMWLATQRRGSPDASFHNGDINPEEADAEHYAKLVLEKYRATKLVSLERTGMTLAAEESV